jgi:5'-deoxynucleotidase YfbR-like HD superfamily hydrolase
MFKFVNNGRNINLFEEYFRETIDDSIEEEECNIQNKLIKEVYSTTKELVKKYDDFKKVLQYIIDKIKTSYPNLLNLKTKSDERILYKPVEKLKRTRTTPIFADFNTVFDKTVKDILDTSDDER